MNVIAGMYYDQDMTYIHSAPMFHLADGGATFGVTACGGRHVFVPRFDAADCLQTMEQEKVTHAAFVPTMINMLVNNSDGGRCRPLESQLHHLWRVTDAGRHAAQGT